MGDKSKIQWTNATWNPLRGCSRKSRGCDNCYAEAIMRRFPYGKPFINKHGKFNGHIEPQYQKLDEPLHWKKPRRIFVNLMSDLFHASALSRGIFYPEMLDWVIAGGESGSHARPAYPDWFRSLRDQCKAAGVPFFMKQITERGKKIPYESFPEDLQVREYPNE